MHPDPARLRAAVELVPSPREQAGSDAAVTAAAAMLGGAVAGRRGARGEFPRVLDGAVLAGRGRPGWPAMLDPAFLAEAGMGSDDSGAVAARPASAAGSHAVPGRRLPGHRAWHQDRRAVLALLRPADPGGDDRRADRLGGRVAGAGGPPARMLGARVPADVAGWTATAAERVVPGALPPVPPGRRGCRWSSSWPTRSCGRYPRWGLHGGGLRPTGRERTRLLPHPLRAVAHRGHGPTPEWIGGTGGGPSRRCPRPGRSACAGWPRWWWSRCCSACSSAPAAEPRSPMRICGWSVTRCAAQQVASIGDCETERVPGQARTVAAAGAGPSGAPGAGRSRVSEQVKDVWDLGVFGHPRASWRSPGSAQPWLRSGRQAVGGRGAAAPPRWRRRQRPAEDQRAGAAVGEPAAARPDRGLIPAALGRPDIENFLNRLAYLESTGKISRYRRNVICRGRPRGPGRDPRAGPDPPRAGRPPGWPASSPSGVGDIPAEPDARRTRTETCHRRSWPCSAPTSTPCSRPRSGSPPSSPSTPGADPKTSSACRWTAWTATKTAAPCWSMTTPRPTGWAGGCRSARPPPQ